MTDTNFPDPNAPEPTDPSALQAVGDRGLQVGNIDDLWRMASWAHKSGLAPDGLKSPEACAIAMQIGMELGFSPMQALQSIHVIQGKASLPAEVALAKVRSSGKMRKFKVEWTGTEMQDDWKCTVRSQRTDDQGVDDGTFSVLEAKQARLWMKKGPRGDSAWVTFPKRMIYARALTFHLRDGYSDVLKGLAFTEEQQSIAHHPSEPRDITPPPGGQDPILAQIEAASVAAEAPVSDDPPKPTEAIEDGEIVERAKERGAELMNAAGVQAPVDPIDPEDVDDVIESGLRAEDAVDGEIVDEDPLGLGDDQPPPDITATEIAARDAERAAQPPARAPEMDPQTGERIPDSVGKKRPPNDDPDTFEMPGFSPEEQQRMKDEVFD